MVARRKGSIGCTQMVAGAVIILGAVLAFAAYQGTQNNQAASVPTPTVAQAQARPTTAATPTLALTPTPALQNMRIVSAPANLSSPIIMLYFDKTDNWNLAFLGASVGHLEGTPSIGQGGNVVLAGHVELKDGAPGPFARIHLLKLGDPITILSDKPGSPIVMQYMVTEVTKVKPDALGVIRGHGFEELTLVTCDDWDQKTGAYNSRVIVHARPLGSTPVLFSTALKSVTPATVSRRTPTRTPTPTRTRK